jgi:hypothetical protein
MVDIQELGARRRDPENIRRLLNSLARNVGTAATVTAPAKDAGGAEGPVARATVDGHLDSLSRLRLTENSPALAPHMRSATPLQSSLTHYFTDVSSLGLTGKETVDITGVTPLEDGIPETVRVRADDAEFDAVVRIDTPGEADYYRHGGIPRYVLRQLLRR